MIVAIHPNTGLDYVTVLDRFERRATVRAARVMVESQDVV